MILKHSILTSNRELFHKIPMLNLFDEVLISKDVSLAALKKIVRNANRGGNNVVLLQSDSGIILKKLKPNLVFDVHFKTRF